MTLGMRRLWPVSPRQLASGVAMAHALGDDVVDVELAVLAATLVGRTNRHPLHEEHSSVLLIAYAIERRSVFKLSADTDEAHTACRQFRELRDLIPESLAKQFADQTDEARANWLKGCS